MKKKKKAFLNLLLHETLDNSTITQPIIDFFMNRLKPKKGAFISFKRLVKRGDIPQKQSKVEYMVLAKYRFGT